ncbi:MAG: Hsp33 family molecular chaperone HslO, partial [Rhodospirillales bacterium]
MNDQPSPIPAPLPDAVYPFQIEDRAIRGRLVRLSRVSDAILHAHSYPERVANLLAENLALAAALASGLKYDGIFTLQVQGDGPLGLLVADITSEGVMRGYARFDETRLADVPTDATPLSLFGKGYIAFTVDQGPDTERYQGITEVVGETLADCANAYFRQSEQLATAIQLATDGRSAAALMLQRLPAAGGGEIAQDVAEDDWQTAVILAGTATPLEMLDLSLAPNRAYRKCAKIAGDTSG